MSKKQQKPKAAAVNDFDKLLSKPETTAYADELVTCFHDHVRQMVDVADPRLPNDTLMVYGSALTVLVGLGVSEAEILHQTQRMATAIREAREAIRSERAAA